jgi:hypothetical protein
MALAELDRVRYARQLLLPEIGSKGQERLCAAQVRVSEGDPGAGAVALEYLGRAGVSFAQEGEHVLALPDTSAVVDLAGAPELLEAARALSGALAAVETIKAILELGKPLAKASFHLSSEEV